MTIKALIIRPDCEYGIAEIEPTLSALQGIVGGYIKNVPLHLVAPLSEEAHLYCNEEGKLDRLPVNPLATALVEHYRPGFTLRDVIVGTVVVLGSRGAEEGDVPQDVIDTLSALSIVRENTAHGTPMRPKHPEVTVQMAGQDGNAVAIVGRVQQALRHAGVEGAEISTFVSQALSGDYDHLLQTVIRWVEVA